MSIYPLDRTKRYRTPGGCELWWNDDWTKWDADVLHTRLLEADLRKLFGESLIPVIPMTEVTVEFDGPPTWINQFNIGLPMLKLGTLAHFTVTMRYPEGSELKEEEKS